MSINIKCPDGYIIGGAEYKECPFPFYGVAPHVHQTKIKNGRIHFIGSTAILPKEQWPDNFKQDPEDERCGEYLCPYNEICKEKEEKDDMQIMQK